jgi:hypothetical protein
LAQRAISSEWDYRTVGELVEALQARRISASELVEHTIARIEALDQRLNAVVVRDFKRARETAKAADVALARGERRPLLGVPITIKESFNITGLPTTYGVPRFKDFVPKEDAVLVSRVKSAGAVILGKTNVPLLLNDLLPGTSAARLEGHRAGLPQHSPLVLGRCRLARISVGRCACRHTFAVSTLTSQPLGLCPIAAARRRRSRPCSPKAILSWSVRWLEQLLILRLRSTWSRGRTRSVRALAIGWRYGPSGTTI